MDKQLVYRTKMYNSIATYLKNTFYWYDIIDKIFVKLIKDVPWTNIVMDIGKSIKHIDEYNKCLIKTCLEGIWR